MILLRPVFMSLVILLSINGWAEEEISEQSKKPLPPSKNIPKLEQVNPVVICGDCNHPFDTSNHKQMLTGLVSNKYIGKLREALYLQDTYHQFESKAHFDNCDFAGSIKYTDELIKEINDNVVLAQTAKEKKDKVAYDDAISKAFFNLGQVLHSVQDFYAHTNYVELNVNQVKKSTDIEVIPFWKESGKIKIKELTSKDLVSGYVFWGIPQKCPKGTLSHGKMAKDKATTISGSIKVPHLQNLSRYDIAVQLATEASQKFIDYAFKRWPLLKEANGETMAFEIFVDRRGI